MLDKLYLLGEEKITGNILFFSWKRAGNVAAHYRWNAKKKNENKRKRKERNTSEMWREGRQLWRSNDARVKVTDLTSSTSSLSLSTTFSLWLPHPSHRWDASPSWPKHFVCPLYPDIYILTKSFSKHVYSCYAELEKRKKVWDITKADIMARIRVLHLLANNVSERGKSFNHFLFLFQCTVIYACRECGTHWRNSIKRLKIFWKEWERRKWET